MIPDDQVKAILGTWDSFSFPFTADLPFSSLSISPPKIISLFHLCLRIRLRQRMRANCHSEITLYFNSYYQGVYNPEILLLGWHGSFDSTLNSFINVILFNIVIMYVLVSFKGHKPIKAKTSLIQLCTTGNIGVKENQPFLFSSHKSLKTRIVSLF